MTHPNTSSVPPKENAKLERTLVVLRPALLSLVVQRQPRQRKLSKRLQRHLLPRALPPNKKRQQQPVQIQRTMTFYGLLQYTIKKVV